MSITANANKEYFTITVDLRNSIYMCLMIRKTYISLQEMKGSVRSWSPVIIVILWHNSNNSNTTFTAHVYPHFFKLTLPGYITGIVRFKMISDHVLKEMVFVVLTMFEQFKILIQIVWANFSVFRMLTYRLYPFCS